MGTFRQFWTNKDKFKNPKQLWAGIDRFGQVKTLASKDVNNLV